jgi:polyketide cyclase/dehydrase/lipid transport protein
MLVYRHQAFVRAPVPRVWELVGHPDRHPEWWPELVEIQGDRFGRGCSYCQVTHDDRGVNEMTLIVEHVDEFKELAVRCAENGLYMRWLLSDAQGGTLVDAEFGVDPTKASAPSPDFDADAARTELERWLRTSLDGLAGAHELAQPGP